MIKLERIKLLARGLHNLRDQFGLRYLIQRGWKTVWKIISTGDLKNTRLVLSGIISRHANGIDYTDWIKLYENLDETELVKQKELALALNQRPKFSIVVPTYNTPGQILTEFIESVLAQTYPNWELCIAFCPKRDLYVQEICF